MKWIYCVFAAVIAAAPLSGGAFAADESPAPPVSTVAAPAANSVVGVLSAKGENWIEVKADGAAAPVRYRARWIGGAPSAGGGYDRETLTAIRKLVVSRRVRLSFNVEEGPRVLRVEMIDAPKEGPRVESGDGRGVVTAKGEGWVEIRSQDVTERYSPRWIGGLPRNGGGLDRQMLSAIAAIRVGQAVRFEWINDERKRVVVLRPL